MTYLFLEYFILSRNSLISTSPIKCYPGKRVICKICCTSANIKCPRTGKRLTPLTFFVRWFHLEPKGSGVTAWPHQIRLNWERCLAQQKGSNLKDIKCKWDCHVQTSKTPDPNEQCWRGSKGWERRFHILVAFFQGLSAILHPVELAENLIGMWIFKLKNTHCYFCQVRVCQYLLAGVWWTCRSNLVAALSLAVNLLF